MADSRDARDNSAATPAANPTGSSLEVPFDSLHLHDGFTAAKAPSDAQAPTTPIRRSAGSSNHSTPVTRVHSSEARGSDEARAGSMAEKLLASVKKDIVQCPELETFFCGSEYPVNASRSNRGASLTNAEEEMKSLKEDALYSSCLESLGKEDNFKVVLDALKKKELGISDRIVFSGHGKTLVPNATRCEPKSFDTQSHNPDVVLLTRSASQIENIQTSWGPTNTKTDGIVADLTTPSTPLPGKAWHHLAAIGELKPTSSSENDRQALAQIIRRFYELIRVTFRVRVFAFTIVGSEFRLYLLTPSAIYRSPIINLEKRPETLIVFLCRLSNLSDAELGVMESRNVRGECSIDTKPLELSAILPPKKLKSVNPLDCSLLLIGPPLFRKHALLGRSTSTYRVKIKGQQKTFVVTFAFTALDRIDIHDKIRKKVAAAKPKASEGLLKPFMVLRGDPTTVPLFLKAVTREPSTRVLSRALEVTFFEKELRSLMTCKSMPQLVKALIGIVKGLENLHKLGIVHRDISIGNLLVDKNGDGVVIDLNLSGLLGDEQERAERSGTFPYMSRSLLDSARVAVYHGPWLDAESLVYVTVDVLFHIPAIGPKVAKEDKGNRFWREWNSNKHEDAFFSKQGMKSSTRQMIIGTIQPNWQRPEELIDILSSQTGLAKIASFTFMNTAAEDEDLKKRWATGGDMGWRPLLKKLKEFQTSLGPARSPSGI